MGLVWEGKRDALPIATDVLAAAKCRQLGEERWYELGDGRRVRHDLSTGAAELYEDREPEHEDLTGPPEPLGDLKEALGTNRKPDITHVRVAIQNYIARACEYGSAKYERANYARFAESAQADFERLRSYLRAVSSHTTSTLEAMELHQSGDPQLTDLEGMRRAAYAEDTDAKPGCAIGASGLPHLAHAAASLMMALTQATECELLPRDPGTPWVTE